METTILFKKSALDNMHYRKLQKQIKVKIKHLPKHRKRAKYIIAFVLPLLYFGIYLTALYNIDNILIFSMLYALLGVIAVLIFISLIHDAVHNNIFNSRAANRALTFVFDFIGGNSFIWRKRHMVLHHNYQNIVGWDSDIEQAGLIKIYPHVKTQLINRFQHVLIFVFYPLYLFNWIFIRDFKDFFLKTQMIRKVVLIPKIEYVKLFVFKTIFIAYILIIPMVLGMSFLNAFMALCVMLSTGSVFALLSLLTPHANVKNDFPKPDLEGHLNGSWMQHQFNTTNDVNLNNWFTKYIMGNFNYHLAHHLFPNISSIYAPEVTEVIKNYSEENGFGYRSYGLIESLKYHYQLIKCNAIEFNILEEDM